MEPSEKPQTPGADPEPAGERQTHGFQAEVRELLKLMIHSLYSHRDIFLRELISNASDACDRVRFAAIANSALLAEDPELGIRVDADPAAGTVTVTDNGIGIEPDLLPNVFELFEQGTRTLDRGQGGLGVGLTLVRRLVELHNGGVEARSAGRGQGAEFIVSLPCLSEVQPAQAMAAGVPSQAKPGADGCRVLVVDDNLDAADTVAMFLRTERHVVLTANDGAQALACAASFAPEVVLLDIGLPGLDGYAVARSLRQLPVTRDALLIALTGYGQQSDRAKAREAGFNRHLVKPADPHALAEAIVQWRMASKREPGAATGA